jgi:hypothetical protein
MSAWFEEREKVVRHGMFMMMSPPRRRRRRRSKRVVPRSSAESETRAQLSSVRAGNHDLGRGDGGFLFVSSSSSAGVDVHVDFLSAVFGDGGMRERTWMGKEDGKVSRVDTPVTSVVVVVVVWRRWGVGSGSIGDIGDLEP